MALRFLYLLFLRVSQLIRLSRLGGEDLVVEVVMLRREVAVLTRQVSRPIERCWPGWLGCSPAGVSGASLSNPTPCFAGAEIWSAGTGPTRHVRRVGRRFLQAPSPSSSDWPRRTPPGVTGEFTASSQPWASHSRPRASGPSCAATTSSLPRGVRAPLGPSSAALRPRSCSPATSSALNRAATPPLLDLRH